MFTEIKKLFSHTVIYGLGTYSYRVLGFFLIPVYTRYLVPDDYGILGLATMLSAVLFIFLNLGQSSAFFRSYFDHDDPDGRKSVLSTSILLTLVNCLFLGGLLLLFAKSLSWLVFGSPIYVGLFVLICLASLSRVFLRIPFAMLRAEEKSARYAVLSVLRGLTGILIALALVVGFGQGIYGVMWSQFASHFVFCLLLIPGVIRGLRWSFSKRTARDLLAFGTPHVPMGLATFVLNLSDRYFLKHYSTLYNLGLYSLGYNLGEALRLLVTALHLAYPPFVLSNRKAPHAQELYARVTTYYFALMGFIALALSLLAREIIGIMAAPSYHDAYRVIPLVALAQIFYGFSFVGTAGLIIKRRPIYRTFSVFVAAAVNLALNYLWIPSYGMMGAAVATVVAFLVGSLLITGISYWFYPVPYEYGRLLKLGIICWIIYGVGVWVPQEEGMLFNLLVKASLLLLFPCLLLVLRFFQNQEIESALGLLRTLKAKLSA